MGGRLLADSPGARAEGVTTAPGASRSAPHDAEIRRRPQRSRRSSGTRAATALVLVGLLSGCVPASAPGIALPDGVEVELYQLRSDVAERGAQVRVVNGSDEDLVVTTLTFEDDWFTDAAERERVSTIAAGRTVDLRIALPESACDDEPDAAARTSRVTLHFTAAGGSGTATLDVADPLGFTTLIHQKECLRSDLSQLAALNWSAFAPSAAPEPAQLTLSIDAAGGAPGGTGRLNRVETTNLLKFGDSAAAFALDVDLPTGDAVTEVAVPILPLRCDPHAVMEDKRGTVFNVAVDVGGAAGVVEVAASEEMRGEILRWVADWCGFGPGSQ